MKFQVNYSNPFLKDYNVKIFDTADEVAQYITENMDDNVYDEMLDECYGEIDICGMSYSASIALYRVDEVAYNCGRNDYYGSLANDIAYDVDRMEDEEKQDFYDFTVTAFEDEEKEGDE